MTSKLTLDPLQAAPAPSTREGGTGFGWRSRLRATAQVWFLNIGLSALISVSYLRHAPDPDSPRPWIFLHLGLVVSAFVLSLPPGLLLTATSVLLRRERVLGMVTAVLWTFVQVALFADTVIYDIFRYHFNGMIWNVLTTPGGSDTFQIEPGEVGFVVAGGLLLCGIEYVIFVRCLNADRRRRGAGIHTPFAVRPGVIGAFVLLPLLLLEMGIYAHADLYRDRQVTALTRLFPLYPRLTVKRFARDHFGFVLEDRPSVAFAKEGVLLRYPRTLPRMDPDGPRPNILVIVIDSLRADMLSEEVMPRVSSLTPGARVFRNHLSGGNATRFGIFSMIYGLHGCYWRPIYDEQCSPVLVDVLLDLGYDLRILTSASMSYPEFRSTAWVRIEDHVEDRLLGDRPGGRDDGIAKRFEDLLTEREGDEAPFFVFALLDAPHQPYSFPEGYAVFEPFEESIAYLRVARGLSPEENERIFNRFRNSVHYADEIAGAMLDSMTERGLLDSTLVVVTGDHGQEFLENGFLGHTSNFTAAQVHVPLLLRGPGIPPGEETRPTSHLDLPATLLELLGADPAGRAQWCLGENLLSPPEDRRRVVSGWDSLGMWVPGAILHLPTASHRGGVDVYDTHWRLIADDEAILRREGAALGALALECKRFLR